jgi:hypothetical protein
MTLLLAVLVCLAGLVQAEPLTVQDTDVTFDWQKSYTMLHYAYASYDKPEVGTWDCKYCTNGTVGFTVTASCEGPLLGGEFAYIGFNSQDKEIVASYRGSSNIQNWVENIQIWKTPNATFVPDYPDVRVEHGFYEYFEATQECIFTELNSLMTKYPDFSVSFTGHSLGASGASIAAIHAAVNLQIPNVLLMTYGSPRTGNVAFANLANDVLPTSQRMVNGGDCVPKLPWIDIGYYHIATEIYEYPTTSQTYETCPSTDGESCGNGAKWDCAAHTEYMNLGADSVAAFLSKAGGANLK